MTTAMRAAASTRRCPTSLTRAAHAADRPLALRSRAAMVRDIDVPAAQSVDTEIIGAPRPAGHRRDARPPSSASTGRRPSAASPACRRPPAGRPPTATRRRRGPPRSARRSAPCCRPSSSTPTRPMSRHPAGRATTPPSPACGCHSGAASADVRAAARRRGPLIVHPSRGAAGRAGADRDHGDRPGHHARPPLRRAVVQLPAAISELSATSPARTSRPRSTRAAATTSSQIDGVADPGAGPRQRRRRPGRRRRSTPSRATTPRSRSTPARTASPPTPSRGPGSTSTASCSRPTWSSRPTAPRRRPDRPPP